MPEPHPPVDRRLPLRRGPRASQLHAAGIGADLVMRAPLTPRQLRLRNLHAARQRIDDEILVLEDAEREANARAGRMQPLDCGSEQSYQRHAHLGDTATERYRVGCEPCRKAHADHERARAAGATRHAATCGGVVTCVGPFPCWVCQSAESAVAVDDSGVATSPEGPLNHGKIGALSGPEAARTDRGLATCSTRPKGA